MACFVRKQGAGKVMWRIVPLTLLTGMAAAVCAFWAMDREPPVVLAGAPQAETPEVAPGEIFYARYTFFRKKSCTTHVDRFLMDATRVRFVVSSLDFPAGALKEGWDDARVPALIPLTAAPGPAVYWTINSYMCNPFHRLFPIVAPPREIKFTILPKKKDTVVPSAE